VQRLAGCLSSLPERLRLVLELRAGIATGRPLSVAVVSHQLHLTVKQVRRLQKRGLRLLILTARTHTCGGATPTPVAFNFLGGPLLGSESQPPLAAGGVEAARYSKPPAQEPSSVGGTQAPAAGGPNALGLSRTAGAGGTLLAVGIVLSGMLLIALLFAEELGIGPHLRRLRARWLRRPPP
jgi:hypothetical protein